jgi:MFS family permease
MSRSFYLLLQGQLVSQIGTQVFLVAILLWLQQTTSSATLVGLLMTVAALPGVLLGLFGGAVADRFPRRTLIAVCDLVSGLALLSLAATMLLFPERRDLALACLFAVALVVGGVGAVFQPTVLAFIPDLVGEKQTAAANSMVQSSLRLGALAAQALGGILFRVVGAPLLVLFDGVTYLFSAISELFIRVPSPAQAATAEPEKRSLLQEVGAGLRFVSQARGLRSVFFASSVLRFFVVPFNVLFPFYVAGQLAATPDWYGFLMAGSGFGVLVGYVLGGAVKLQGRNRARTVSAIMIAMSLGFASLGVVYAPVLALVIVFVIGVMEGVVNVQLLTVLQLATPVDMRGRVFGLMRTIGGALAPLAMASAGIVADLTGKNIGAIYLVCGAAMLALSASVAGSEPCQELLAGEKPTVGAVPAAHLGRA